MNLFEDGRSAVFVSLGPDQITAVPAPLCHPLVNLSETKHRIAAPCGAKDAPHALPEQGLGFCGSHAGHGVISNRRWFWRRARA